MPTQTKKLSAYKNVYVRTGADVEAWEKEVTKGRGSTKSHKDTGRGGVQRGELSTDRKCRAAGCTEENSKQRGRNVV